MATVPLNPSEARLLAHEAYVYGYAMVQNYRAIYGMCVWKESSQYSGFNTYLHGRKLFDADYDLITNANNDTLYSTTFADLRNEPIVVSVPPTGDRYFSIQLVDLGTDNFAYIGTRATGTDGGDFLLVGPTYRGTLPRTGFTEVIVAPSQFVALATRTAIDGISDLPGVIAIQDQLAIRTLSDFSGATPPAPKPAVNFPPFPPNADGTPDIFPVLNFLLGYHTATLEEAPLLRRLARLGIGANLEFNFDSFPPDVQEAITEGTAEAQQQIEAKGNSLGTVIDGWQSIPHMGNYGDNYLFRSAVAWKFIYTNSPEEAIYPIAETDADGQHLSGEHDYILHFPAGQLPPVNAFWSITLYDSISRLMVHNPLNRFSVSDRTPGLIYGDDGSLTLYIQHASPGANLEPNWLPSAEGDFYLNIRAYLPEESMLDGTYRLPAVKRVR